MKGTYGQSAGGNFKVIDTISVPHPYMITSRHVVHASDRFFGVLSEEAIRSAEKDGARCGTPRCQLSYSQHEQALLVGCLVEIKDADGHAVPELHEYLLSIKEEATRNGYVGFAFKKGM